MKTWNVDILIRYNKCSTRLVCLNLKLALSLNDEIIVKKLHFIVVRGVIRHPNTLSRPFFFSNGQVS